MPIPRCILDPRSLRMPLQAVPAWKPGDWKMMHPWKKLRVGWVEFLEAWNHGKNHREIVCQNRPKWIWGLWKFAVFHGEVMFLQALNMCISCSAQRLVIHWNKSWRWSLVNHRNSWIPVFIMSSGAGFCDQKSYHNGATGSDTLHPFTWCTIFQDVWKASNLYEYSQLQVFTKVRVIHNTLQV